MSDWWLEIDRKREQDAFRQLVPNGGCLALVGDRRSGLAATGRLLISRAPDFGYEPYGISRARSRISAKQYLLDAWEFIAPAPPTAVIPRWRVPGVRLGYEQLVAEIAETVRARHAHDGKRIAFVFETPDYQKALIAPEASAFCELAEQAQCPVIVTSWLATGTGWPREPACLVRRLGDFSRDDVLEVLMRNPSMSGRSLSELQNIADMVTGGASSVPAETAYARLFAWAKS